MDDGYVGVFLTENDIQDIVKNQTLVGKPVLLEHGGKTVLKKIYLKNVNL